jgi:hypothetical protein
MSSAPDGETFVSNEVRCRVNVRGIPPVKAARLGLTFAWFDLLKDQNFKMDFPQLDPILGNCDLKAIDLWMDSRADLPVAPTRGTLQPSLLSGGSASVAQNRDRAVK